MDNTYNDYMIAKLDRESAKKRTQDKIVQMKKAILGMHFQIRGKL